MLINLIVVCVSVLCNPRKASYNSIVITYFPICDTKVTQQTLSLINKFIYINLCVCACGLDCLFDTYKPFELQPGHNNLA